MKQNVSLRGIAKEVSTIYVNRRTYHVFTLQGAEDGSHKVYVRHEDTECDIEDGCHLWVAGFETESGIVIATSVDEWGRICDHCGTWHTEGYYSENTGMYFCSDECLKAKYTQEEIDEEIIDDDGNGYLYWTEWD